MEKILALLITVVLIITAIPTVLSDDGPFEPFADVYVDDDAVPSWYDATHVHTIQEGVTNVSVGGTIYVWDGTYSSVAVNKEVTIQGNGTENTIVSSAGDAVIVISVNDVKIKNLRVTGTATHGIRLWSSGTTNNILLEDLLIDEIIAASGNAIRIHGSGGSAFTDNLTINNVEMKHCTVGLNVDWDCGLITLKNSYIHNCTGSGFYDDQNIDDLIIEDTTFAHNCKTPVHTVPDVYIAYYNKNGNITMDAINIISNGTEVGIRISGYKTGSSGSYVVYPAGNWSINDLIITGMQQSLGAYPSGALVITRFSDMSDVAFSNVALSSTAPNGLFIGTVTGDNLDINDMDFSDGTFGQSIRLGQHGNSTSYAKATINVDATGATFNTTDYESTIYHQVDDAELGLVSFPIPFTNSIILRPANGDGTYQQWTPKNGGLHFIEVNESGTHDGASTEVHYAWIGYGTNKVDTWQIEAPPEMSQKIRNVTMHVVMSATGYNNDSCFNVMMLVFDGQWTGDFVTPFDISATYPTNWEERTYVFDQLYVGDDVYRDFQWSDFDTLQIGMYSMIGTSGVTIYCTQAWLEVFYDPIYLTNESPTDLSTDVSASMSAVFVDVTSDSTFDWVIGGDYITTNSSTDDSSGTKQADVIGHLPYETTINWWTNASNEDFYTNQSFSFTTEKQFTMSNEAPSDESGGVLISLPQVSVDIDTSETFDWLIGGDNIVTTSASDETSGTKTAPVNGPLPYGTVIVWWVNVSNEYGYLNNTYSFTTEVFSTNLVTPNGNIADTNARILARGDDGTLYSVYSLYGDNSRNIYLGSSTDNGMTWAGEPITDNAEGSNIYADAPTLATGTNGNLYVAWHDYNEDLDSQQIKGRFYLDDSWTEIMNVTEIGNYDYSPAIAIINNDNVYLIWTNRLWNIDHDEYTEVTAAWNSSTGFSSPVVLNEPADQYTVYPPSIAVSDDEWNTVYAVWAFQQYDDRTDWQYGIEYTHTGEGWVEPIRILGTKGYYYNYPSIAIGLDNTAQVSCVRNDDDDNYQVVNFSILYGEYGEEGVVCSTMPGPSIESTSISIDSNNTVYIVFDGAFDNSGFTDDISDAVHIARGNEHGIYNSVTESSYDSEDYTSPADTEWSNISEDPVADPTVLDYYYWKTAVGASPPDMVDNVIYMHIISEDRYFEMHFTYWQQGGGGGFSYTRYEIVDGEQISDVTFTRPSDYGMYYCAYNGVSWGAPHSLISGHIYDANMMFSLHPAGLGPLGGLDPQSDEQPNIPTSGGELVYRDDDDNIIYFKFGFEPEFDSAPDITDVERTPDPIFIATSVNITCTVTDENISDVRLIVTGPVGFTPINISMSGSYHHEQVYDIIGTYTYYIWAIDNLSQISTSDEDTFDVQERQIFYVDTSFNSGTPGWHVTHWDIIHEAVENASTGGLVLVNGDGDIYNENVYIDASIDVIGNYTTTRPRINGMDEYKSTVEIMSDLVNFSGFYVYNNIGRAHNYNDIAVGKTLYEMGSYYNVTIDDCYLTTANNGVLLRGGGYCTVKNCEITTTLAIGIAVMGTNHTLRNNYIHSVTEGIDIQASSNCNIYLNTIQGCSMDGIRIFEGGHTIYQNNFTSNGNYGIRIQWGCAGNLIYHNNFVSNHYGGTQADDSSTMINYWNLSYPQGGNYWNDHGTQDIYYGPEQNLPGGDGICDLDSPDPYDVGDNDDEYPFMGPFGGINIPIVATNGSSDVEETTATIYAYLMDDGGESCQVYMQYGETTAYDSGATIYNYTSPQSWQDDLIGLDAGQLYHFRAKANNSFGTGYGDDMTFLTKPNMPTAFTANNEGNYISLGWTKAPGANTTYIESRATIGPWAMGEGTPIYNNTGSSYGDFSTSGHWYYQAWSYIEWDVYSSYSDDYATADAELNNKPVLSNEDPANGTSGHPLSLTWNIDVNDNEGESIDITIECSNGDTTAYNSVGNGTYSLGITGLAYTTTYTVWVNATDDGSGLYTREWFGFNTLNFVNNPPNQPTDPQPTNNTDYMNVYDIWLNCTVSDPDGDELSVHYYWGNGTYIGTINGVENNTVSQLFLPDYWSRSYLGYDDLTWVLHDTIHDWYAIADDGDLTNQSSTWNFNTNKAWDLNADRRVNVLDVSGIVSHYALRVFPPGADPWDINEDTYTNVLDLSSLVSHYGQVY